MHLDDRVSDDFDATDYFQTMDVLVKYGGGHIISRFFSSLFQLGVFDHLEDGPKHYHEIAKLTNSNSESIYRLMRFFVPQGLFVEEKPGIFSKTKQSSLFTKNGIMANYMGMFVSDSHYQLLKTFPETIVKGEGQAPKAMGVASFWDCFKDHAFEQSFTKCMLGFTKTASPNILKHIDFSNYKTIVDIGGSHGDFIKEVLKLYPTIKHGINFDKKEVIEKLKQNQQGENQKLQLVSGNFLESVPRGDCMILKHILHDWSDEDSKTILNNVADSLEDGGHLYIFDFVIDPKNYNQHTLMYDLLMLHLFTAKERTKEQWLQLVQDRFTFVKFIHEISIGCIVLKKK
ncbi:O-methyltransferase family 2 protein [Tieghemostelium lacteum]|uniref:O-methyltransferase family 2 protein n=1 Tax=Tieghemostelium lacteum TaxID=361077 RepID=A0A151Z5V8_TIELA|nr:O-methyltransferase family 2 protein [Tieghemostelium lacteum]|eukprot:KYQ89184.1 O-methyltransferase family 2 protein [Tieghemostelium lacteum]